MSYDRYRDYDADYLRDRVSVKPGSKKNPVKTTYEYTDGSEESHTITRKGPPPPSKYIAGNQDGPTPEGVHITSTPRTNGELRRKYTAHLDDMYTDERISEEERDARKALAEKAETDAELRLLISDLPGLPVKEEPQPKLTWAKIKKDFIGSVTQFWNSGVGTFAKFALFVSSFVGAIALGVIPACVLLGGVHHPSGVSLGVSITCIGAAVVWIVANIVGLIKIYEG